MRVVLRYDSYFSESGAAPSPPLFCPPGAHRTLPGRSMECSTGRGRGREGGREGGEQDGGGRFLSHCAPAGRPVDVSLQCTVPSINHTPLRQRSKIRRRVRSGMHKKFECSLGMHCTTRTRTLPVRTADQGGSRGDGRRGYDAMYIL